MNTVRKRFPLRPVTKNEENLENPAFWPRLLPGLKMVVLVTIKRSRSINATRTPVRYFAISLTRREFFAIHAQNTDCEGIDAQQYVYDAPCDGWQLPNQQANSQQQTTTHLHARLKTTQIFFLKTRHKAMSSMKKQHRRADQQKLPRRDSRRKLVRVQYRVVQCRPDAQINPIFELGNRKKVSMKSSKEGRGFRCLSRQSGLGTLEIM